MLFSGTAKHAHDERPALSCQACSALVPRGLMRAHRAWHDEQGARPFHGTGRAPEEGSLEEFLAVIGQMKAIAKVRPRAEFVADLRERLMAETLDAMIDEQAVRSQYGDAEPTNAHARFARRHAAG